MVAESDLLRGTTKRLIKEGSNCQRQAVLAFDRRVCPSFLSGPRIAWAEQAPVSGLSPLLLEG